MRKCLIAIAILLIPIAVFSQEKGIQSTKKYILASFHYSPSGSGMLYFNNGAEGIGGSVKYGLEFPIASSSFHLETGAGVGVLASRNYTPQFFYPEELESELYPYFYVPLGVNYKINVSSAFVISPHMEIAGVIGFPDFGGISVGGIGPVAGMSLQFGQFLLDASYNIMWTINSNTLGQGYLSIGGGWYF